MFFIIGICFFYLSKIKRIKIRRVENVKDIRGIVFGKTMKVLGDKVIIGKYKVSDIVNAIEKFVKEFNHTNKWTNIASGIVSILSACALLASAVIL